LANSSTWSGRRRASSGSGERHEFGLFSRADFETAFSGLELTYDAEGLMGRGLYIGVKPLT